MKKTFLGLRTTIYKVPDLQKAIKWYTEAFETEPYFNEPFYVGFNIAGYELGLIPDDQNSDLKTANVLSYWAVENVEEVFQRLIDLGATAHENPQNVGGELVVGGVKDPWGNVIGIIYNPYFKPE